MNVEAPWTVYRTRFVVRARQLTQPLSFINALGREHSGHPGDYLIETPLGCRSIMPQAQFEDIYVPLQAPPAEVPPSRELAGARPARSVGTDGLPCPDSSDRRVLAWGSAARHSPGSMGRLAARGS